MFIAVRTGLEPATPCVTGMYSNQAELPHHFIALLLSLSIAVAKVRLFLKPAIGWAKKNLFFRSGRQYTAFILPLPYTIYTKNEKHESYSYRTRYHRPDDR